MFQKRLMAALVAIACTAIWAGGGWRPGDGIQTVLDSASWPETLKALESLDLHRRPYFLYKRDLAYDHDITILTPFARAAEFVQSHEGEAESLTFEVVSGVFDPSRLVVRLKTSNRSREKAEGVRLVLKTDTKTIEPSRDTLEGCYLKAVGFYAEMYNFVQRSYAFDLSQLQGAKTLTVVIIERTGKSSEVRVNLAELR
jgi:hypothetical protein